MADMTKNEQVLAALEALNDARRRLTDLGVFVSKKWHSELGEWLVSRLLNGRRAASSTQSGWDLIASGTKYQVKTNFVPPANASRYTDLTNNPLDFDELVILGLNEDMKVSVIYKVTRLEVQERITKRKQDILYWTKIEDRQWDVSSLVTYKELRGFFANG